MTRVITNFDMLATTPARRDVLAVAEAGYGAIDTEAAMRRTLTLQESILRVGSESFDLKNFDRIKVLGFGKASCRAVQTIESILRSRITEGIAIDVRPGTCEIVSVSEGTHPHPSVRNVELTRGVVHMAKSTERDLVLVAVSGGGSSLLCWPLSECEQGMRLYDDVVRVGATIEEINTIRKHLSEVKGGGLASMLFPATVIGLVFCDIPGDDFANVASGPTYYDESTREDAQKILDNYGLLGYTLTETPKDKKYFDRVHNVAVVSNTSALDAMEEKARLLGYEVARAGAGIYDTPAELVARMRAVSGKRMCVAAGEPRLVVTKQGGKGGRCQYAALEALISIAEDEVFLAFASDGIDNSDSAGAIVDSSSKVRVEEAHRSVQESLESFNTYDVLDAAGDLLFTGDTESNVSDLFIHLRV